MVTLRNTWLKFTNKRAIWLKKEKVLLFKDSISNHLIRESKVKPTRLRITYRHLVLVCWISLKNNNLINLQVCNTDRQYNNKTVNKAINMRINP
jgi:hypothetical protein